MPERGKLRSDASGDTQLETIRDLMLAAGRRGAWLTLAEIAELTEIGEASISAQLRHLRKRRHGRHVVEKRRRNSPAGAAGAAAGDHGGLELRADGDTTKWEYRVLPPSTMADGVGGEIWPLLNNEGGGHAEARA